MRLSTTHRLAGLDASRTLAILGMFAAHIFPLYRADPAGTPHATAAGLLASGRASALFMVLAGVSLGLFAAGLKRRGYTPGALAAVILRRAAVIAVLGMLLGPANERIANILVHYGLLFAVLSAALFLPSRVLGPLALVWLAGTPFAWRLLAARPSADSLGHNPSFSDLLDPGLLFEDLTVTGYYPLLVWCGFGLLGLWISRFNLTALRPRWWLLISGAVIAAASLTVGWAVFTSAAGDISSIAGVAPDDGPVAALTGRSATGSLDDFVIDPRYVWLPAPHSTSLIATVHAAACAVAVLGLFLLVADRLGFIGRLLAAAGRAPLTLYAGHLVVLPLLQEVFEPATCWWILCVVVLGTAIILERTGRSAPLEAGVRYLSGSSKEPHH